MRPRWIPMLVAFLLAPVARAESDAALRAALERALQRVEHLEAENRLLRGQLVPDAPSLELAEPADQGWLSALERSVNESRVAGDAWARLEIQLDTREFNTLHLAAGAPLPYGFTLSGFVDFESPDGGPDDSRTDASEFFYELDLRRPLFETFGGSAAGLILELNDTQGTKNSLARAGIFLQPRGRFLEALDLSLFFKVFPYESDGHGHQWSVSWGKTFPDGPLERLSLAGFLDLNVDSGPRQDHTHVVSDTQIRFRVAEGLHALAELRYNELLGGTEDFGVGLGVQLRF